MRRWRWTGRSPASWWRPGPWRRRHRLRPPALDVSSVFGWPSLGPAWWCRCGRRTSVDGALALAWSRERAEDYYALDPALPASFAEQATLALQIVRAREDRERLAVLEDRDRIGRDLHDVVIQRLFAVGLGLQSTR